MSKIIITKPRSSTVGGLDLALNTSAEIDVYKRPATMWIFNAASQKMLKLKLMQYEHQCIPK